MRRNWKGAMRIHRERSKRQRKKQRSTIKTKENHRAIVAGHETFFERYRVTWGYCKNKEDLKPMNETINFILESHETHRSSKGKPSNMKIKLKIRPSGDISREVKAGKWALFLL